MFLSMKMTTCRLQVVISCLSIQNSVYWTHVAQGQYTCWCKRSGFRHEKNWVVAGTFYKSSAHNARLKIEAILSVLHDTRIQSRWIPRSMLLGKKSLSPRQKLAINGTSRKKIILLQHVPNLCSRKKSPKNVSGKCPRKMSRQNVPKSKGKPNYKPIIKLENSNY